MQVGYQCSHCCHLSCYLDFLAERLGSGSQKIINALRANYNNPE